jgi:energy-converting hydrogenase B subunit I
MMGMSKIVKTISSIVFPFSVIYGLYVIAHGHLTPGGGFQGGAIVASACAMILVAFGSVWTIRKIKEKHLSVLESLGALGFIGIAFLGLIFGIKVFFNNFLVNQNVMLQDFRG